MCLFSNSIRPLVDMRTATSDDSSKAGKIGGSPYTGKVVPFYAMNFRPQQVRLYRVKAGLIYSLHLHKYMYEYNGNGDDIHSMLVL